FDVQEAVASGRLDSIINLRPLEPDGTVKELQFQLRSREREFMESDVLELEGLLREEERLDDARRITEAAPGRAGIKGQVPTGKGLFGLAPRSRRVQVIRAEVDRRREEIRAFDKENAKELEAEADTNRRERLRQLGATKFIGGPEVAKERAIGIARKQFEETFNANNFGSPDDPPPPGRVVIDPSKSSTKAKPKTLDAEVSKLERRVESGELTRAEAAKMMRQLLER
ncbi:hypothetical protein LCGC14_1646030, partial [marine sediment metagenome]